MPNHSRERRRTDRFRFEPLEPRNLMTGGFGNQFAEIGADITTANGTATVQFTIDPALIKHPRGTFMLGIDVSAQDGETVQPTIVSVQNAKGKNLPGLTRATYVPAISSQLNGKTQASAIVIPITAAAKATVTYTVVVAAQNSTSGSLDVGFYLPGDVNGTGTVTKADLQTIRSEEGTTYGATSYSSDMDSNRNGVIDKTDLAIAKKNLGVSTTIIPTVDASILGSSTFDAQTRTATAADVTVNGTATPGTEVALTEINGSIPKVTAVADSSGNFSLVGQLKSGSDTLTLAAADGFGQTFEETMLPIVYTATATANA